MNHKNIRCVFIYKFVLLWIYECTQLYNLDKAFHAISAVANKKKLLPFPKAASFFNLGNKLHHSTHSSHSGSTHRHFGFIFFLFYNHTFSSQEHTCDRSGIFQSNTCHFSRIYHTCSMHIFVNIGTGIVTKVTFTFKLPCARQAPLCPAQRPLCRRRPRPPRPPCP